jgi:hypothetical protein
MKDAGEKEQKKNPSSSSSSSSTSYLDDVLSEYLKLVYIANT